MKYFYLMVFIFCNFAIANTSNTEFKLKGYYDSDFYHQKLGLTKSQFDSIANQLILVVDQMGKKSVDELIQIAYLENPQSETTTALAAVRYLSSSLMANNTLTAESLEHSIVALYYLERLNTISKKHAWAKQVRITLGREVNKVLEYEALTVNEQLESHAQFHHAFNVQPEHGVAAGLALVDSLIADPGNVMTLTLVTGSRLWLGGEVSYSDPNTLYYFILTSFYSTRAILLSHELEKQAKQSASTKKTMRLSSILGGWTTLPRRWLAEIHHDPLSQSLIEQEHHQWFSINPGFHSITLASSYFNEDPRFFWGYGYLMQGLGICNQNLLFRSCADDPRFSFNRLVFLTTIIDYSIKAGDFDTAQMLLGARYWPEFHWNDWSQGHAPWQLREQNMQLLHEQWNNADASDDLPLITTMKRQWGDNTMTCQTCHQEQNRSWTAEEKERARTPSPSVEYLQFWPEISTSWTGDQHTTLKCDNINSWQSNTVYRAKQQVVYQHALFEAKWWTRNEVPSKSKQYDVWQFVGFCQTGSVK
ncbi:MULTISPECIES: carbohydrate-binding protein [Pseudoalteromonas]|uniref:carbohydrate-binding protein n=1 Tax=Pseudoalteromonas TaxID=53246 RepID=UPI000FFE96B9|nr:MULTISPECIES: hypothetical protein [unclassified Pseudoalteromonas]MCG9761459.1 hypothetical protein [Pseudoalteromonas sp. Isolate6]RXE89252.1 hypothetical protein DRB05_00890 [Pseudoalteromonas sp. A757]